MGRGLLFAAIVLAAVQAGEQPPRFRAGTAIVPVDVRVLDATGRPVTDLTRNDFAISEDGVPQVITQFQKQTGDVPSAPPRWIVIVLGQGRLQQPFRTIDALEDFVSRLRRGDHLGVIAYNRWSEFTTDTGAIVALLQRYKARADRIQTILETHNTDLREKTHNGLAIDVVQTDIDALFRSAPGAPVREFAPGPETGRMSTSGEARTRFTQIRFSDALHLYGAIDYLRLLNGEKHVIALVEQGSPIGGEGSRLAATAADNRVAVHVVQTGGLGKKQTVYVPTLRVNDRPELPSVTPPDLDTPDAGRHAREATAETGGLSFFYTDLPKAFGELALAMSVDYVVGYTPSNQAWKGEQRAINVRVNRPGVTVLYRHAYHAVTTPVTWDDRVAITDARLTESRTRDERGLVLRLTASRREPTAAKPSLEVELAIEPSQVAFTTQGDRHVATLNVAIWVTDARGQSVADVQDRIDLRLTDASYRQLVRSSINYARRLSLSGPAFRVRATVYDYDNDRIGTISVSPTGR